jgi:hypothetical protein
MMQEDDQLVDVTPMVLAGVDPMVVRLPVRLSRLGRGKLIIVSDAPFSPLFVLKTPDANRVSALDPIRNQFVDFVPIRSLFNRFHFDLPFTAEEDDAKEKGYRPHFDFVVMAVSLFDVHTYAGESELPLLLLLLGLANQGTWTTPALGLGISSVPVMPPSAGSTLSNIMMWLLMLGGRGLADLGRHEARELKTEAASSSARRDRRANQT